MSGKLSQYGGLDDRVRAQEVSAERTPNPPERGVPRHVWVDETMPGLLLMWRRTPDGWFGYVVWAHDGSGAMNTDWVLARRLTPHRS